MGSGIVDLWNKGTGIKLQMEVNEQKLFDTNNSESVERNPLQDVPSKVVAGSVKDSKPETDTKIREFRFESEKYCEAVDMWPQRGRHIMAQYTDKAILVYQAFKPEIAEYATLHQSFEGCKSYKTTRMTWIKTNFLWMMYRSGWACKKNQEVIQISSTKKEVTIASLHGIRSYSAFGLREIFSNGCCGLPSRHSMENMPRMKTDLNAPKVTQTNLETRTGFMVW